MLRIEGPPLLGEFLWRGQAFVLFFCMSGKAYAHGCTANICINNTAIQSVGLWLRKRSYVYSPRIAERNVSTLNLNLVQVRRNQKISAYAVSRMYGAQFIGIIIVVISIIFMLMSSSSDDAADDGGHSSLITHHHPHHPLQMSSYIYQDKKWIQLVHVSKQKTKHELLWVYIPQQWAVKAHLGMPRPTKMCQADGNECILGWGIHPRYTLNKRLFPLFVQDSSQVLTLPKSLEIVTETMDNVDSRQNACMINIHMTPIGGM